MSVKNITKTKRTLVELHAAERNRHRTKQNDILKATGTKGISSFYDIINGNRKLSPAEKTAIAAIYQVDVVEIDWKEEKNLPETDTKS